MTVTNTVERRRRRVKSWATISLAVFGWVGLIAIVIINIFIAYGPMP